MFVKRWISDVGVGGSPHILFASCKPSLSSLQLMKRSQAKVSVLHVASSPSALQRPGQRLRGIHRKGNGKDAKATTT